jgi:hypothetical protein
MGLRSFSVVAKYIKDRFENSDIFKLLSHKNFLEADYFLFMRTICNEESKRNIWIPQSCVDLRNVPTYLEKAESNSFLEKLLLALGFENKKEEFIKTISEKHGIFYDLFARTPVDDPLDFYDFNKIGKRR